MTFNRNKAGLFESSFSGEGGQFDPRFIFQEEEEEEEVNLVLT